MNLDKLHQSNLGKLKEKMGLVEKVSKRCKRYLAIVGKGFIEKQEVINLRSIFGGCKRNNLTDKEMTSLYEAFLYPLLNEDTTGPKILIGQEHTAQGLDFLRSLYLTPKGKLKKTNHLSELEDAEGYGLDKDDAMEVIENFSHFQFNGFKEDCSGYGHSSYQPVWTTIAKDGTSFDYVQTFKGFWAR